MKSLKYITFAFLTALAFASCEKTDYPRGLTELEHHYYAVFVPNNNTGITATRNQTTLLKFPVQFYSTFTRDYDAIAKYSAVVTPDITAPAVVGQDFAIVDRNGVALTAGTDGFYSMVFPKAVQTMDTIYIKMLNNTAPGVRKIEIQLKDNITDKFDVDIFSTAFRRPIQIN
jgi:hypothetical protein